MARIGFVAAFCTPVLWAAFALATNRDYTLVTNQSSITLSGTVTTALGTAPIQQQGPGGLTATYSGTVKTDRGTNTIAFLSGSSIDANPTGNWRPLADGNDGTASADYGAKITQFVVLTTYFAGRDLAAGVTSDPLAIDGSGAFDMSAATVNFITGNVAYRGPGGSPMGALSFAGQSGSLSGTGALSTLSSNGQTTETITFPVNATFNIPVDTSTTIDLTITGQLVAKSTFATPLLGDYNSNGVVDAADYVVWQNNLGSATSLPNDDTSGVGVDDYNRWRSKFGQAQSGSGADALKGTAVPEASAVSLLAAAIAVTFATGRRERNET